MADSKVTPCATGLGLFGVLGVLSIRFRNGLRGKMSDTQKKYLVKSEDDESSIGGAAVVTEASADGEFLVKSVAPVVEQSVL